MKKTYEKPTLVRREQLSKVTADASASVIVVAPNGSGDPNGGAEP